MKNRDKTTENSGEYSILKNLAESYRVSTAPDFRLEHLRSLLNTDWRATGMSPSFIACNNLSKKQEEDYLRVRTAGLDWEERKFLVFPFVAKQFPSVGEAPFCGSWGNPVVLSGLWRTGEEPDPFVIQSLTGLIYENGKPVRLLERGQMHLLVIPYHETAKDSVGASAPFFLKDDSYAQPVVKFTPLATLEKTRTKLASCVFDQLQFCSERVPDGAAVQRACLARLLVISFVNHLLIQEGRPVSWFKGDPLRPEKTLNLVGRVRFGVRRFWINFKDLF